LSSKPITSPLMPSTDNPEALASGISGVMPDEVDLSRRATLIEMMDEPCSYEDLRDCLRDIARVNRLTFAYRPTILWIEEFLAAHPSPARPLRIVDVGCGDGDMLRRIDVLAAKRGVPVELTGVDLNADAVRAAKEATVPVKRLQRGIQWLVGDGFSNSMTGDVDLVICSLLTHHLTDQQIVQFLLWAERTARLGWFVNDLHRKPVPYHLFRLWAQFTSWHPFVKNDGPVSIRRSFVVEDWNHLCAAAGLEPDAVSIKEYRPARLCVGRVK
jgi:SAM-dependent methyltransferase